MRPDTAESDALFPGLTTRGKLTLYYPGSEEMTYPQTVVWEGNFQFLALDGGGIKGLFTAAVLAKLEETCDTRIIDHFDLISGTSTGGIIAIGLGLGMRPREIVEFYVREGPRIFGNRFRWRNGLQWIYRKFPQKRLEDALKSKSAFGDRPFGESSKRLVIPSYNLAADKVRVFRTAHHPRLRTDWRIPAWQIALATSAAPTYFPVCKHVDNARLVDGGIWANNPSMVGFVEGMSCLGVSRESMKVWSIGTTTSRTRRRKLVDRGGMMQWAVKRDVFDILMRGQSIGVNGHMGLLLGQDRFFRIDPVVPDGMHRLDRIAASDLLAEAEDAALHFGPQFEQNFMSHKAVEFTPVYSKDSHNDNG